MPFAGSIQIGEEFADIQLATSGLSKHGATVPFDSADLQLHDPADSANVTIAPHSDGALGHFTVTPTAGATVGSSVALDAHYDGRPGAGVVDLVDSGILSLTSPDAATPGAVVVTNVPVA